MTKQIYLSQKWFTQLKPAMEVALHDLPMIKRTPRARGASRKGNIANLVLLSERPPEAQSRAVLGHWEGDVIKGASNANASAIGTAVERHSHYLLLTQMNGCTATHTPEGFSRRFADVIPELRRSFTYDRVNRMACHEELAAATGMPMFLLRSVLSLSARLQCKHGGLARQFLPRRTDLSAIAPQLLAYIEAVLNDCPRKSLDFRTPSEVYTELVETHRLAGINRIDPVVSLQGFSPIQRAHCSEPMHVGR